MSNSKKRCLGCKNYFPSDEMIKTPVGLFHDMDCRLIYATKNSKKLAEKGRKIQRSDLRKKKESLRDRKWYIKEAQKWFNKFIRLRDFGGRCISCQNPLRADNRLKGHLYDAGHYRSIGSCRELRFNEDNCHAQCVKCNRELSGNIVMYRLNLINKIGVERLNKIESYTAAIKWGIDDLKDIIRTYKAKCKEIESNEP